MNTKLNCRLCMWTGDNEEGTYRAKAPDGRYHVLCTKHKEMYAHRYTDIHPLTKTLKHQLTTMGRKIGK